MASIKIQRRRRDVKHPKADPVCNFCGRAREIVRRPFGLRVCDGCARASSTALFAGATF